MKDDNWREGGSSRGYGGMKRFEGRDRNIERRTIEHPDGRREIIETIREEDVRSFWFSAATDQQYAAAADAFRQLAQPSADRDTSLHQLEAMKNDIMRQIQQQLPVLSLTRRD